MERTHMIDMHEKPMPYEGWNPEPVYGFEPDYDPMPADVGEGPERPALLDEDIPF